MSRRVRRPLVVGLVLGVLVSTLALSPSGSAAAPASAPEVDKPQFELVGRYATGGGAATGEIASLEGDRMYVTNGLGVDIVDTTDPTNPVKVGFIDTSSYGDEPTSVAVKRGVVAVAVPALIRTDPGKVVFFDTAGAFLAEAPTGSLPDMVTFNLGGSRALVANEGEPNSYDQADSVDPEGSVTIVSIRKLLEGKPDAVRQVGFTDFNAGEAREAEAAGLRLNGPGASVAQDIEPEYITTSGNLAYVTLQEANAVAVIDMREAVVLELQNLGTKDHSLPGSGLDASDRDNAINIANWPVSGLYMPDAVAAMKVKGVPFYVTANEGDARDYTGFLDEVRVGSGSYVLDPAAYPNAASLKNNANLGRLTVSATDGDTDGDGDIDRITAFGGRSVSIWAADGSQVWDSGDLLEQVTASANPGAFNSNHEVNDFDTRSDNKGPEPEGVATGKVQGRSYAFVGLERAGGVVVIDATDPTAPEFVQYLNNRTFVGDVGPDSGAEGVQFVPRSKSPTKRALVVVSHEISGSVSIFQEVTRNTDPDGAGRLTLLHNNDGESSLLALNNSASGTTLPVGGIANFKTVLEREIADGRNLGNAVLSVYAGDSFLASATLACSLPPQPDTTPIYDAVAQAQIPYDVQAFGNHEFDLGPDFLERFVRAQHGGELSKPFLASNLDFSAASGWKDLVDNDGLVQNNQKGRIVGRSAIEIDPATKQRFGIVSAITPTLPTISSPSPVQVTTADLAATATVVQAEIDRMTTLGITKIILVSHLQNLSNDQQLVSLLNGVDVAVAGGGDEQLAAPGLPSARQLLPGDPAPAGTYPVWQTDLGGRNVPIVTTSGNYKYVGRLDVTFDDAGELESIDLNRSYPRRVVPTSSASQTLQVWDSVTPDAGLVSSVVDPVQACLAGFATPVADTEVLLNVSRQGNAAQGFLTGVRTGETNGGNLVADGYLAAYDTHAPSAGLPARGPGNPVIAVQNGGGIRQNGGDFLPTTGSPPGSISRLDTLNVMAFDNTMTVVNDVAPDELKAILERSVAALAPAAPGSSSGAFLQIAGFEVVYDPAGTAQVTSAPPPGGNFGTVTTPGSRVLDVTLDDGTMIIDDGVPVPGAPNVRIVTNNFTAAGGDNFEAFGLNVDRTSLGITYERSLFDYVTSFPIGVSGRPTIPASDTRYALAGGEGRISFLPPPVP